MRGGHNRKPTALKAMAGTLDARRVNTGEPVLDRAVVPPPPKSLGPGERAIWVELAAQVDATGCYTFSDYTSFRLAVKSVAMADSDLSDMPATAAVRLMQVASSFLQRFGLDPASRARVMSAGKDAPKNDLAEFGPGGGDGG